MVLRLLLFILISRPVLAEKTRPIFIGPQIKNSTGVIYAVYKGSTYKKLPGGEILTEFSFKIKDSLGIGATEIINRNHFLVVNTGGVWQGLVYNSGDLPTFVPGEEVVLLLIKGRQGYEISGKKMGKFKVIVKNGEKFLKTSFFKEDSKQGLIKISDFNLLLKKKYGKEISFADPKEDGIKRYEEFALRSKDRINRGIASTPERGPASVPEESMWIIIVTLGVLGAIGVKLGRD